MTNTIIDVKKIMYHSFLLFLLSIISLNGYAGENYKVSESSQNGMIIKVKLLIKMDSPYLEQMLRSKERRKELSRTPKVIMLLRRKKEMCSFSRLLVSNNKKLPYRINLRLMLL